MECKPKEIVIYLTSDGKNVFSDWISNLKDITARDMIDKRLERVRLGNYGDCKSLGEGIFELRFASGLRIYFAEIGSVIVLLLCGGNKKSQIKDIARAKEYWREFKAR
jgi:putative addiction module killer protein